ncbi:acyl-CoA dehydrogenase family protein [Phycicoccus sp. CSK15P-2]|uniref:acyl-CoA dehydrogenase family protein n=1 Tax=Phycicoccus sp. CSK15P-2 TaxID=2807627 RepID=UPI00194F040A|nr:acyl-CoA dehydrogenase family protein [Phycicoccus sp. CSK15P-2]MBM6405592.1 acyl-CoA dehydrogenase family protein [Phycicoccus sp. CSK15P-2]
MTAVANPTKEDLLKGVDDAISVIKERASWSAENRRLHEDTIAALQDAGVFRMRVPAQYGGLETDAKTMVEVADRLAQADGSTAWLVACSWIATWGLGLFPDHIQDEVFSDPDSQVCTTIGPGSAVATPADGGVVVNGSWPCISGAHHSTYQQIAAIYMNPDGEPYPVMGPVRIDDLEITDDWDTLGFRSTGSVGTSAKDLFVPKDRLMPAPAVVSGQSASERNADTEMYRAPFIAMGSAATVGCATGMAKAVRDIFMERLPGRAVTYTEYGKQAEAPVTHLRVAEAMLKIDEAEFHARRLAETVDDKAASGEEWSMVERARCRADEGAAVRLCIEAAEIFAAASGGSSAYKRVPIQQIVTDLKTFSLHAMMGPDVNAEIYGRVLCGLEPNTYFI